MHASAVAAEAAEQGGKSVTISQCLETFEAEEKLDPEDMCEPTLQPWTLDLRV